MPCVYEVFDHDGRVYIGSTMSTVTERMSKHRADYKSFCRGHGYNSGVYPLLKDNDFIVQVIEHYEAGSITRESLEKREQMRYDKVYHDPERDILNRVRPASGCPLSDDMRQYLREKIQCVCCGANVSRRHFARHRRTKRCTRAYEAIGTITF